MAWQDELVTSKDAAIDFLDRHLKAAGLPPFVIDDLSIDEDEVSLAAHLVYDEQDLVYDDPKNDSARGEKNILFFDLASESSGIGLCDGLVIGKNFLGRQFSLLAVKALLGAMHEAGFPALEIAFICRDDASFWPCMTGAVPLRAPRRLAGDIRAELTQTHKLSAVEKEKFSAIADLAGKHPYAAWRALSQTALSPPALQARQAIFEKTCLGKSLCLLPGEMTTRQVLANRLGVLPPFRPMRSRDRYYSIARKLSQSPVAGADNANFKP